MGPRRGLDIFEEGKILFSLLGSEHQWSSTKPSHYTDYAIPVQTNFGWKEKNESYYTSTISHFMYEIFFSDEFNKCCSNSQQVLQQQPTSVAATANCRTAVKLP
jgi:hypothetical protein